MLLEYVDRHDWGMENMQEGRVSRLGEFYPAAHFLPPVDDAAE